MIVEDYTPAYYAELVSKPLPTITKGKFVHVTGPDAEYLILSPTELTKFHSQIIRRFCALHPAASCVSSPSGEESHFDVPGWTIKGGGRFRLDRDSRTLILWDSSKAYGPFDAHRIRGELEKMPEWDRWAIRIDEG